MPIEARMIVLDTHAWIWFVDHPERLSPGATVAIEHSDALGVSVISCWEVGMLVAKGRLRLDRDTLVWINTALALPKIRLLDLTPEIAVAATLLEDRVPGDPSDRMIVATAIEHGVPLVTKDRPIRKSGAVPAIW